MINRQYMLNQELLNQPQLEESGLKPQASQLARFIQSRLDQDNGVISNAELPKGVDRNLRPKLPPISQAALMLYTYRRAVESYPLIYTTLAVANPN